MASLDLGNIIVYVVGHKNADTHTYIIIVVLHNSIAFFALGHHYMGFEDFCVF